MMASWSRHSETAAPWQSQRPCRGRLATPECTSFRVGTQHRSRAAGQWRLTISLRCKPIECREYDSVWIVGNSSPIRFDHDCRVISDRTVMTRFQRFAIGVVPDAALSSDFWRPVLRPHTSPVVPFTSVAATSYGYSGNKVCRYSFQIPNLQ